MIYSANTIAKWFIKFNQRFVETCDAELLTPLKLQKLLYYAQGAFLAIDDTPLFSENIFAWEHGPVVPDVYHTYKSYESNGIPYKNELIELDEHTYAMLFGIYEKYGKHSAWELREMTHSEPPWLSTSQNEQISDDVIKSYFRTVYASWIDGTLFDSIPETYVS